jgi:hypothetical protein
VLGHPSWHASHMFAMMHPHSLMAALPSLFAGDPSFKEDEVAGEEEEPLNDSSSGSDGAPGPRDRPKACARRTASDAAAEASSSDESVAMSDGSQRSNTGTAPRRAAPRRQSQWQTCWTRTAHRVYRCVTK